MDAKRETVKELIMDLFNEKGFYAEKVLEERENGIFDGIRVMMNDVVFCYISTDSILDGLQYKSLNAIASDVIDSYKDNFESSFDVTKLRDRDFLLTHLYVGMCKIRERNKVSKKCKLDGLKYYLFIRILISNNKGIINSFHIRVTEELLKSINISTDEAWEIAMNNVKKETKILYLSEDAKKYITGMCDEFDDDAVLGFPKKMFKELCMDSDDKFDYLSMPCPMFIISNNDTYYGASSILNEEILAKLGKKLGVDKFYVLPSSKHEMILLPYSEDIDPDMLTDMVATVNSECVQYGERLIDRAYLLSV